VEDRVSLFGKMPPFKPGMEIPPEVTVFLEGVVKNAGMNPDHYLSHNGMIEELYEDLEVGMFSKILSPSACSEMAEAVYER
jgi:hypothetical protein